MPANRLPPTRNPKQPTSLARPITCRAILNSSNPLPSTRKRRKICGIRYLKRLPSRPNPNRYSPGRRELLNPPGSSPNPSHPAHLLCRNRQLHKICRPRHQRQRLLTLPKKAFRLPSFLPPTPGRHSSSGPMPGMTCQRLSDMCRHSVKGGKESYKSCTTLPRSVHPAAPLLPRLQRILHDDLA